MLKLIIISCGAGILIGYCYGLLFLLAGRGVFSLTTHVIFTVARFILLLGAGLYLLALPSINPIILILSFLATFWLVILTHKVPFHERHRTHK